MVSVTYSTLHSLVKETTTTFPAADAENVIDQAIDKLNQYLTGNTSISNLSGASPNKTVTVSSAQRGAIMEVAMAIYHHQYKGTAGVGVGSLSLNPSNYLDTPDRVAQRCAKTLRTYSIQRT